MRIDASLWTFIKDRLRAVPLLAAGLVLFAIVLLLNPAKLGLLLWGVAKLCIGGYGAYLTMRVITRDRLHEAETAEERHSIRLARAIVVAAAMLGLMVGVA